MFLFNIYTVYFIGYFISFIASILVVAYSALILKENFEKYTYLTTFEVIFLSVTNIILFFASVKVFSISMLCLQVAIG